MDRVSRTANAQRAYDVQVRAGLEGSLKFTSIGLGLAILAHHTWPTFRKQTLAFKGFLVSGFCIFGLVTYAERALQSLEIEERHRESLVRREARLDLSRRGMVPTETAIAQWKANRMQELAAAKEAAAVASGEPSR